MRAFAWFLALWLGVAPAWGDDSTPLLYSRSHIIINRAHMPVPLPWQNQPVENPSLLFDVDVRDAGVMRREEGWFDLGGIENGRGVMMMLAAPDIPPLGRANQYAPMDIVMVDKEGKIVQIVPDVVLNRLQEDIVPQTPVLAFLFLKGGSCEGLNIQPGDRVEYKLFRTSPLMLPGTGAHTGGDSPAVATPGTSAPGDAGGPADSPIP